MQITIDIPQEFVHHFAEDKFADSLQRLKSDAHLLAGCYEKELIDMLIVSFKNSKVKTGKEEAKSALPKPPHPRWKPKQDENYFMITTDGSIYCWRGCCGSETYRYKSGNVFRTKAEAEFIAERLKVLAEMREWAGNNYDGAYIYYHRPSDDILTSWGNDSTCCFGDIHFKCVDDAENCIKAVGKERLKKYYFCVPEVRECCTSES